MFLKCVFNQRNKCKITSKNKKTELKGCLILYLFSYFNSFKCLSPNSKSTYFKFHNN